MRAAQVAAMRLWLGSGYSYSYRGTLVRGLADLAIDTPPAPQQPGGVELVWGEPRPTAGVGPCLNPKRNMAVAAQRTGS